MMEKIKEAIDQEIESARWEVEDPDIEGMMKGFHRIQQEWCNHSTWESFTTFLRNEKETLGWEDDQHGEWKSFDRILFDVDQIEKGKW